MAKSKISPQQTSNATGAVENWNMIRNDLVMYILKTFTDKDHALTVGEITTYLLNLTEAVFTPRTISRDLERISVITQTLENTAPHIANAYYAHLGGKIIEIVPKKSHRYYYFEPFTSESDLSILCGAITSNRYLSEDEKKYLLTRQKLLNSFIGSDFIDPIIEHQKMNPIHFSAIPRPPHNQIRMIDSKTQLINIHTLYEAITEQTKIEASYGNYIADPTRKNKLDFQQKNKEYLLNPYALIWNNGQYYLVATYDGQTTPVHFRVDRFLTVHKRKNPEDQTQWLTRDPIPEALKPYYKRGSSKNLEFQNNEYTADFPLMMAIFSESDFIDAILECSTNTLALLVDTFGSSIKVCPSKIPHSVTTDYNGNEVEFVAAKIEHVQYSNVLLFCLQQQATVTNAFSPVFALYPPQLVDDIHHHLQQSVKRYEAFQQQRLEFAHPFISNKTLSGD